MAAGVAACFGWMVLMVAGIASEKCFASGSE